MIVHDHRKIHKKVYKVDRGTIELVDIPELQFIVAEGSGTRDIYEMHNGDVLWSISRMTNRLKDKTKNELEYKFKLMPLEMIWSQQEAVGERGAWKAMMQVPDLISQEMFDIANEELIKRNRSPRVPLKLEKINQGQCVQALHVGPYHTVGETINRIQTYSEQNEFKINHQFREVYINQPFCNAPDKLQTIVRVGVNS